MSYYVCRDITLPDSLVYPPPSTGCGRLLAGEGLSLFNTQLRSCDGRFSLALSETGLYLNSPIGQLWRSGGAKPVSAVMRPRLGFEHLLPLTSSYERGCRLRPRAKSRPTR